MTKQKSTLEAVNNSVKLLNEMLAYFSPEDSTDGDKELIRVRNPFDKAQMTFCNEYTLALLYLSQKTCPNLVQTALKQLEVLLLLLFNLTLREAMKII